MSSDWQVVSDALNISENNKASKQEIKWMCRFIGGFEKWPLLADDCKRKVIEMLDYETRLSLGMCSKSDYHLMNTTRFFGNNVKLDDTRTDWPSFQEEEFENVSVLIERKEGYITKDSIFRVFSQSGEDTLVRWNQSRRRRPGGSERDVVLKNCHYYDEAAKYAEMWMRRCRFEMQQVDISMRKYPFEKSSISSFPKCTDFQVATQNESDVRWWLQKLPSQINSLRLFTSEGELPRDFFSLPQIVNAKKLNMYCESQFCDEQLFELKATHITIKADCITDEAINRFIKRWMNGECVKDFHKLTIKDRPHFELERMISGIEVRPWDEEFKEEVGFFWDEFNRFWGREECYQITSNKDHYESLTLHIFDKDVSVFHTGMKMIDRDGEFYTDYWVPC